MTFVSLIQSNKIVGIFTFVMETNSLVRSQNEWAHLYSCIQCQGSQYELQLMRPTLLFNTIELVSKVLANKNATALYGVASTPQQAEVCHQYVFYVRLLIFITQF